MKHLLKNLLIATATVAVAASAQAQYHNGDLLLGFTQAGAANDYILDLGSLASLSDGQTWNLGTTLNGNVANLNNLSWGVLGALSAGGNIFSTTDGTATPNPFTSYNTIKTPIISLGNIGANSPFTGA